MMRGRLLGNHLAGRRYWIREMGLGYLKRSGRHGRHQHRLRMWYSHWAAVNGILVYTPLCRGPVFICNYA